MTINHAEFHRMFAAVPALEPRKVEKNAITLGTAGHYVRIRLAPEIPQRFGALTLASTTVDFEFTGFSPEEIVAFFVHMDRYFQRAGG